MIMTSQLTSTTLANVSKHSLVDYRFRPLILLSVPFQSHILDLYSSSQFLVFIITSQYLNTINVQKSTYRDTLTHTHTWESHLKRFGNTRSPFSSERTFFLFYSYRSFHITSIIMVFNNLIFFILHIWQPYHFKLSRFWFYFMLVTLVNESNVVLWWRGQWLSTCLVSMQIGLCDLISVIIIVCRDPKKKNCSKNRPTYPTTTILGELIEPSVLHHLASAAVQFDCLPLLLSLSYFDKCLAQIKGGRDEVRSERINQKKRKKKVSSFIFHSYSILPKPILNPKVSERCLSLFGVSKIKGPG